MAVDVFSAMTTAGSLADLVTTALIASSTAILRRRRRGGVVHSWVMSRRDCDRVPQPRYPAGLVSLDFIG